MQFCCRVYVLRKGHNLLFVNFIFLCHFVKKKTSEEGESRKTSGKQIISKAERPQVNKSQIMSCTHIIQSGLIAHHYENRPIQIYRKFHKKLKIFR